MNNVVSVLLWLLIAVVVIYCLHLVIGMLALPPAVETIAMLIVGLVFLILILQKLGIISGNEP